MTDGVRRNEAQLRRDGRGRKRLTHVTASAWKGLNQALDLTGVVVLCIMIGVVVLQIYCRYVLNAALDWPEEVARWGFVWIVFVGIAVVQRDRAHIAIDVLANALFRGRLRLVHHVFVTGIISATCMWMLRYGIDMARVSTMSSPAMGWPFAALVAAMPVGAALTLVYLVLDDGGPLARTWNRSTIFAASLGGVALGAAIYALTMAGVRAPISPGTTLIASFLCLMALGVPIGFAMVFATFLALSPQGDLLLMTIPQTATSSLDSFIILAVPFYILAAAVMNIGGVTSRLIDLASILVGHFRGGLGYVNVVTNALMAGISGSAVADAAALSKMLVQPMERQHFTRAYACALTGAASTMAHLIPPSIGLIIYGALATTSAGALFIAGIVPGLLMAAALLGTTFLTARGLPAVKSRQFGEPWGRTRVVFRALPALALPVAIVGGVRVGMYTATEAGAMAAVYALLVGAWIFRELRWRELLPTARSVLMDTITVVFLVAAAAPFAWTLTVEQLPQTVAAAISSVAHHPVMLLLLINVLLLVVGCFMEMIAAMVILVPIFLPMVKAAGIDPVHFGVIVVLNLVIGTLTPPFGMVVFVVARVGGATISEVFRAINPFLLALLAVLAMVTYFPEISLSLGRAIAR
jgi:C4-dicarboxylate transporter DctM subunit